MNDLILMAFELKIRQCTEYIKDWIRGHCDLELEPTLENEVIRVIDDASNAYIGEMKEQKNGNSISRG